MTPTPGPYDDAIAAIGVQINSLAQELKALREGHAGKADLDAVRAELNEARSELKALSKKNAEPVKPPKPAPIEEPVPIPDADSCASGFW